LSRIVKFRATVSAEPEAQNPEERLPLPVPQVIKRGLSAQNRRDVSTDFRLIGPRDPYLEELNRLKIEIEQARSELRRVRGGIDDSFFPEPIIADKSADDDSFGEKDIDEAREIARRIGEQATKAARELEKKAYETLKDAEENVKQLEAKSFHEAQQIKQQAHNEGYLEGFNKGFDEAQEEFRKENEPRAELLADLIENLSEFEQKRLRENENELVELALGVASKIIGQELRTNPKAVVKMLTETVMQNHSEEYVRITLAEDLFPLDVKTSDNVKKMLTDMGANVSVLVESAVKPGTVQAETPKGITDMSVDTQLDNIRDILGKL
jgi:flagellar assembly protein FliH